MRFQHLLLLQLLSLESPTPMLKVDPWLFFLFSDCHATRLEFPHYVHARDIFVFSSYVTLIPLQCVQFTPYSLHLFTKTWKTVSWTKCPLVQMSLRVYWAFSCQAPCQASFRHLPVGLKFQFLEFYLRIFEAHSRFAAFLVSFLSTHDFNIAYLHLSTICPCIMQTRTICSIWIIYL